MDNGPIWKTSFTIMGQHLHDRLDEYNLLSFPIYTDSSQYHMLSLRYLSDCFHIIGRLIALRVGSALHFCSSICSVLAQRGVQCHGRCPQRSFPLHFEQKASHSQRVLIGSITLSLLVTTFTFTKKLTAKC